MKTSIVVPVFNSGESLQQLLVCLTRQKNCPEFEVVIVDDCSQQELAPIVEKYGRQLRLKFLRHEKHLLFSLKIIVRDYIKYFLCNW